MRDLVLGLSRMAVKAAEISEAMRMDICTPRLGMVQLPKIPSLQGPLQQFMRELHSTIANQTAERKRLISQEFRQQQAGEARVSLLVTGFQQS